MYVVTYFIVFAMRYEFTIVIRYCADSPVMEWRGMGSNPAWDINYIFILIFSLPPRAEQLSGAHENEIKQDHSPVVIVVLNPRYD